VHNAGTRTGLVLRECALLSQSCVSGSDIGAADGEKSNRRKRGLRPHSAVCALCSLHGESRVEWLCGYTEITPRAILECDWTFADIFDSAKVSFGIRVL
jgi:hypothetical protein